MLQVLSLITFAVRKMILVSLNLPSLSQSLIWKIKQEKVLCSTSPCTLRSHPYCVHNHPLCFQHVEPLLVPWVYLCHLWCSQYSAATFTWIDALPPSNSHRSGHLCEAIVTTALLTVRLLQLSNYPYSHFHKINMHFRFIQYCWWLKLMLTDGNSNPPFIIWNC